MHVAENRGCAQGRKLGRCSADDDSRVVSWWCDQRRDENETHVMRYSSKELTLKDDLLVII